MAVGALVLAVVAAALALLGAGGHAYDVHARFQTAGQLVKGDQVQVAGRVVGSVGKIALTDDGEADIELAITDEAFKPLRQGTAATIRQTSLSGVANRYVELRMPDGGHQADIDDGGLIPAIRTTTVVDLDEVFNTIDEPAQRDLRKIIRGFSAAYARRGREAHSGFEYVDPALSSTSALLRELNRDTPLLRRFITASGRLMTDVAAKRDHAAGLVDNLATTFTAVAARKQALAQALTTLPQFMRRSNTTFANLRATLDDLTPLIDESKPVVRKLRPFLAQLRPFARDARPTLAGLAQVIRRPGKDNDLVEVTRSTPPVARIATGPVQANGKQREGAFPATAKALHESTAEFSTARPYAVDLTGWFDDFSHGGVGDALGGISRVGTYVNAFQLVDGVLQPVPPDLRQDVFKQVVRTLQMWPCPGASEGAETVWKPTPDFPCNEQEVFRRP